MSMIETDESSQLRSKGGTLKILPKPKLLCGVHLDGKHLWELVWFQVKLLIVFLYIVEEHFLLFREY